MRRPAGRAPEPAETVEEELLAAAEEGGYDSRPVCVAVGRLAEFMAQWAYGRPCRHPWEDREIQPLLPPDPHLPVPEWVEANGGPPDGWDLAAWARLFRLHQHDAFCAAAPLFARTRERPPPLPRGGA